MGSHEWSHYEAVCYGYELRISTTHILVDDEVLALVYYGGLILTTADGVAHPNSLSPT
jgi:hypothetical protein